MKHPTSHFFSVVEVSEQIGAPEDTIVSFIERKWITLSQVELKEENHSSLDDEDVARIQLILELKKNFEVNDESIPIILHLIDQLNYLQSKIKKIP